MVRPVAPCFGCGSNERYGNVCRARTAARAGCRWADAVPTLLRERARARLDGRRIWRVGNGDVPGALLDVLGLGGREGRVCAVCISQVGGFRVRFFECLFYLSARRSFIPSFE